MPQKTLSIPKIFYHQSCNTSDHRLLLRKITQYLAKIKQFAFPPATYARSHQLTSVTQLSANLPSLGDLQLFPEPLPSGSHAYYLTKITKSILLNFLELTTILSADPSAATPKLEDIKRLFLNAHHLINMYRPHQARETLIMMMEEQLGEGRREMEEYERVKAKVEESLKAMEELGLNAEGSGVRRVNGSVKDAKAKEMEDTQRLWQMIHEMDPD
jgi:mediator of RNA polymerase II transcription subunit 7